MAKLFDDKGNMPAGVRMMLEQMLRAVAPDLGQDIDVLCQFVRTLDDRLKRIEQALGVENDNVRCDASGTASGERCTGENPILRIAGPNS